MLNVSYLETYGYMFFISNNGDKYLRCNIHPANCLFATCYHYRKPNEETGKMEKWTQLCNWFNDLKHLKRCFDQKNPIYSKRELQKVILFTNCPHFEQVAKIIAKAGFKVIITNPPKSALRKECKKHK